VSRASASTWLVIIATGTWFVTTVGTALPTSQLTPYVITTSPAVAELAYSCVLCLRLDGLTLFAAARMIRSRTGR
jgi:hypothetical protein